MRAPLCSDSTELCPEEQGIGTESESSQEIQAIERPFEKCYTNKTAIFGICLDNLMGTTPQVAPQIPFILSRLCRYIEEHGLHYKHLFLEGDETNIVESLKIDFIESGDAPLEVAGNVASVAKLLLIFFEELPEPLIPLSSQSDFIKDMEKLSLNALDSISHLKQSVCKLPDSAYHVLKYLSHFLLHVASHKEINGMSSDSLSVIFGPVIFRSSSEDPLMQTSVKNVMNNFVKNYHAIFDDDNSCSSCEENLNLQSYTDTPDTNNRRQTSLEDTLSILSLRWTMDCQQLGGLLFVIALDGAEDSSNHTNVLCRSRLLICVIPCPSTVMPVMTLMPLSVVIPLVDANNDKSEGNVPILLIEGRKGSLTEIVERKPCTFDCVSKESIVTRKRKERRLSGEETQPRSSSEERPAPTSLISLDKLELRRRCSSHEEMKEGTVPSDIKFEPTGIKDNLKGDLGNSDSFASMSLDLVMYEKNHSPHPPNAKRREVESNSITHCNYNCTTPSWMNINQFNLSENNIPTTTPVGEEDNFDSKQNSVVEIEAANSMECDTSENLGSIEDFDSANNNMEDFRARIPRSASCPVPNMDNTNSSEESNSLSMSWSMLFESEDSEPIRSEHRYSWPLTKEAQDDSALLSPSVQSLRKSDSYYEAPLSPSACRSYLSYRSHHLDPSVPPSPPVEQEDFAKSLGESSVVSDTIKQLTKKIHSIKKRIRKFDEKFEAEFGYKPSHAEKANHPDAKKLMNDLHKSRKELKALKEESHLEQVSPASWHSSKSSHVLSDSTNQFNSESKDLMKPSVEYTYDTALKSLSDDRKCANRPESVEAMTTQQVKDEKVAIQKALLDFESIHGKPSSKAERNTIRPLYDRYRSVKKLLVRSGSFPGAVSKNKDLCSELQPILEHETMDFTSLPTQRSENDTVVQNDDSGISESLDESYKSTYSSDDLKSSVLSMTYDNSNIHELPLSEMIFQLQQVKSRKRHLRKILREFESEFLRLNGRKVQKEDKAPVDALYGEYKHAKARLKLLEALISKHDQHQLM